MESSMYDWSFSALTASEEDETAAVVASPEISVQVRSTITLQEQILISHFEDYELFFRGPRNYSNAHSVCETHIHASIYVLLF
jgi:hypothetical protein